jgi:uncharacterized protein (DUF2235 family)
MPKNIVLLSDGTGNSAGRLLKTNVWRVYEALCLENPTEQVACYDDGIGTSTFKPWALLGGAFGVGFKRNLLRLYRFLCEHYEPGDRIYAFGFSRGAFTIRVLVGMICDQGIIPTRPPVVGMPVPPDPAGNGFTVYGDELARLSRWAYREFRKNFNQTGGLVNAARWVRDVTFRAWQARAHKQAYDKSRNHEVTSIEFVGVWDTVDAYGMPIDEIADGIDRWVWPLQMPECDLNPKVRKGCHAVALDDERNTFHPVLWNESEGNTREVRRLLARRKVLAGKKQHGELTDPTEMAELKQLAELDPSVTEKDAATTDEEWITQVWFAGMHANVGGGYPDDALSCVPLTWMLEEAEKRGLLLYEESVAQLAAKADPLGRIYDSRSGVKAYYRYNPRSIRVLTNSRLVKIRRPKIHHSVIDRLKAAPEAYAPIGFPESYVVVDDKGAILPPAFEQNRPARLAMQENVWDFVWLKRVVYFATVAATLVLVILPFRSGAGVGAPVERSAPARLILTLGGYLPSAADRWVNFYAGHSLSLLIGAAFLAALTWLGARFQGKLCGQMRRAWLDTTTRASSAVALAMPVPSRLCRIRCSRPYQGVLAFLRGTFYPHLFGIGVLVWMVAAVNRLVFEAGSSLGMVCRNAVAADSTLMAGHSHISTFASSDPCAPTGVQVEAGATYRLDLTRAAGEPWKDQTITAPFPEGFSGFYSGLRWWQNLFFLAATPVRRHWTHPWFVPIARVGQDPFEQYALPDTTNFVTPRTSGRLFVFVNDAILPLSPFGVGWRSYYRNNLGSATVTVTKVSDR